MRRVRTVLAIERDGRVSGRSRDHYWYWISEWTG
jgi:hypothetical protein